MASQIVQIPFVGGVNSRTAAEYLDPNTAQLDIVNGIFAYDGAVDKRLGVTPLATTQLAGDPVMGAPVKLMSRGPELLSTDGDSLFSHSPDGAPVWAQRALASPCVGTRTGAFTTAAATQSLTFAEGAGRRAYAYRDSGAAGGSIYLRIESIATGALVLPETIIANGTYYSPVVVFQAGGFFLFYSDGAGGLWCASYTPNGTHLNTTTVVADLVGHMFDATPEVGGPGILVMYPQTDGTGVSAPRYLRLENLPAVTITASGVLATGVGTTTLVACRYDGALGVVWMMYEAESAGPTFTLHAQAFTTAWVSIHAVIGVSATMPGYVTATGAGMISVEPLDVAGAAAATHALFMSGVGQGPGQVLYAADGTQPAVNAGAAEYPDSYYAGRPFRATVGAVTRCYVPILLGSAQYSGAPTVYTYLLMDTMTLGPSGITSAKVRPRAACVIAPRQSSQTPIFNNTVDARVPACSAIGNPTAGMIRTVMAIVQGEEYAVSAAANYDYTVQAAQFDFTQAIGWSHCEGNGETFVSGGVSSFYDGASSPTVEGATPQQWGLPELGFFSWPNVTNAAQGTGGTLTTLGAYEFAVCWAQVDSQGLIHRSPFNVVNITLTGSNDSVTLTVQDLEYSGRYGEAPVYLEIYRTQANLQTLYFVGTTPSSSSPVAYATPLTYTDNVSDVTIATRPLCPTTGGVLDSVCPPSSRDMIRHVDRMWLIDDSGQVIWFSTPFGAGDAPYFNETLTLQFTTDTLTALADLDDKLVAFSARHIWYVEGYGPPNTGLGSDLTTAVQVPTETGANDWRGVVTVSNIGVFFQSPVNNLIYLLDRGLGVTCVGLQVQDWFPEGTTVLAATQMPLSTEVRFVLSTGYVVTYSTTFERWSRQRYVPTFSHAIIPLGGAWSAAASDGHVYQENDPGIAAPYFDTLAAGGTQWVTTTIKLAPFKPGGLQGAAQLDFIQPAARSLDPADMLTSIAYNYGGTSESRTFKWSALTVGSPAAPGIVLARMSPSASYSQPMAASVTLSDAPPTGGTATTGQGMRWLGVAFSVSSVGNVYDQLGAGVKQ
jgi:hypothetical protein